MILLDLYHLPNELLFITRERYTIAKKMDMDSHCDGNMEMEVFISNNDFINIFGDRAEAIRTSEIRRKMLHQPIKYFFKYIRIWKSDYENWKFIGGRCAQL